MNRYLAVLAGTGLTFLATMFGSAIVFFFRKEAENKIRQLFLGFASGSSFDLVADLAIAGAGRKLWRLEMGSGGSGISGRRFFTLGIGSDVASRAF